MSNKIDANMERVTRLADILEEHSMIMEKVVTLLEYTLEANSMLLRERRGLN